MFQNLTANAFKKAIEHEQNTVLLDVRTKEEYEEGHLPGAIHLNMRDPQFDEKAAKLDKTKTYMIYCRSGVRSASASFLMSNYGLKVYNLQGGIITWEGPIAQLN